MTQEFIDEVKQEIADETSSGTGTLIDEVEADLMVFGQTKGFIGKLKISHEASSTNTKVLSLTLDEDFIDDEADTGNLCSLRVTQYGDMRSFISSTAETGSYGTTEDMVTYFDCISDGTLADQTRTFSTLSIRSSYD